MHAQQRKPFVVKYAKFLPKKIEKKNSYKFQMVILKTKIEYCNISQILHQLMSK